MDQSFSHINLIQVKAKGSIHLAALEISLRKAAKISFVLFMASGIIIGSVFVILTRQNQLLQNQRSKYITQINAARNKEGLLISIKERIKIVSGVLGAQRPWATLLDAISPAFKPPVLTHISANQQNKINIGFTVDSFAQALAPMEHIMTLTDEKKIRNPQIETIQISDDGNIKIVISFTAAFQVYE